MITCVQLLKLFENVVGMAELMLEKVRELNSADLEEFLLKMVFMKTSLWLLQKTEYAEKHSLR